MKTTFILCLNVRKLVLIEISVWLEVEDFCDGGVMLVKLAVRNMMSCCLWCIFWCRILRACRFRFFLFFPFLFRWSVQMEKQLN